MIKTTIETILDFTFNTAIDSVQTSKKIFVDTFVKHEALAKSLNEFVDTQTEYTKKAVDATVNAGKNVYTTVTDSTFYTDSLKTVQETVSQFTSKKSK